MESIILTIMDEANLKYMFRVKPSIQFGKIREAYAERNAINVDEVKFIFRDQPVANNDTPEGLKWAENDIIIAKHPPPQPQIVVFVKDRNDTILQFRLRITTKLDTLMDFYAKKLDVDVNKVLFLFKSKRIERNDTPKSLGMQDRDIIKSIAVQLLERDIQKERVRHMVREGEVKRLKQQFSTLEQRIAQPLIPESMEDMLLCKICLVNHTNRFFLCGHRFCGKCAERVLSCEGKKECPYCRCEVTQAIPYF